MNAPKPHIWRRRAIKLAVLCALLFLGLYLARAPLLTALGKAWVVDEPIAKADAIVILGGGLENRPFAAAKLFHAGVAPRILYMDVQPGPVAELGLVLPEAEQTRRILLSQNVPETALSIIGQRVASTYDETQALRGWLTTNETKTIIIPTDLFHTRRVRWVFNKQLRNSDVKLHVIAIQPLRYTLTNWWRHEEGLIAFQNEVLKSGYYRIKY